MQADITDRRLTPATPTLDERASPTLAEKPKNLVDDRLACCPPLGAGDLEIIGGQEAGVMPPARNCGGVGTQGL
jgi:hypothetical protein